MARRQLGFSVDEWDGLPWWQQRLYVEGLVEEFFDGGEQQSVRERVTVLDLDEDGPEALAQFGMSVRTG